jgi:hypothetical protein
VANDARNNRRRLTTHHRPRLRRMAGRGAAQCCSSMCVSLPSGGRNLAPEVTRGCRWDGCVAYPYGRDPLGHLVYTSGRFMFVTMPCADRPPSGQTVGSTGPPEQKERGASGYPTYCGRVAVGGDTIEHQIERSLLTEWVGTVEELSRSCPVTNWFSRPHHSAAPASVTSHDVLEGARHAQV